MTRLIDDKHVVIIAYCSVFFKHEELLFCPGSEKFRTAIVLEPKSSN